MDYNDVVDQGKLEFVTEDKCSYGGRYKEV